MEEDADALAWLPVRETKEMIFKAQFPMIKCVVESRTIYIAPNNIYDIDNNLSDYQFD